MVSADLFLSGPNDTRAAARRPVDTAATLRETGRDAREGGAIPAAVRDLSATGLRLECARELTVGQRVRIGISGLGVLPATVVRRDEDYGCAFDCPLTPDQLRAAPADTVVPFDPPGPWTDAAPEPEDTPYPRWVRVLLLLGISLTGWGLVYMLLK